MGTLLTVVVIGLMVVGVIGFLAFGRTADKREKALAEAPKTFDAAFDGKAEPVIWKTTPFTPLQADDVIRGAAERGYKVESSVQESQHITVLTFVRRQASP